MERGIPAKSMCDRSRSETGGRAGDQVGDADWDHGVCGLRPRVPISISMPVTPDYKSETVYDWFLAVYSGDLVCKGSAGALSGDVSDGRGITRIQTLSRRRLRLTGRSRGPTRGHAPVLVASVVWGVWAGDEHAAAMRERALGCTDMHSRRRCWWVCPSPNSSPRESRWSPPSSGTLLHCFHRRLAWWSGDRWGQRCGSHVRGGGRRHRRRP
jgi:hypothetical protein